MDTYKLNFEQVLNRKLHLMPIFLDYLSNKIIVITGAGGSLGSSICLKLATSNSKLILIEHDEERMDKVCTLLKNEHYDKYGFEDKFYPYLVDIRDYRALLNIFHRHLPNYVIHTASYKYVDLIEENKFNAIKTVNYATQYLLELSLKYEVQHFLHISTDKAVEPINVYGVLKRLAELECIMHMKMKSNKSTKISVLRVPNIIDSIGSVFHKFIYQINHSIPITIAEGDYSRYFVTLDETSRLALSILCFHPIYDLFYMNSGPALQIYHLASNLFNILNDNKTVFMTSSIKFIHPKATNKLTELLCYEFEKSNDLGIVNGVKYNEVDIYALKDFIDSFINKFKYKNVKYIDFYSK